MSCVQGLNRQYQVNPLHLYPDRRPKPFVDPMPTANRKATRCTHYYMRIRTKGGHEGIYGDVDKEALPRPVGPLRPLLIGQNALAVETHLGPDVSLEPSFARQPFHDGDQLYRQRALGSARPAFRRAGVPVVRRPDAAAGARLWKLPGVLHRSRRWPPNAPRACEGRLHSPEVVPGVWSWRRRARHGSERCSW